MRLYLCSYRLAHPKELFKLVNRDPSDISVAVIPNAKDYYADRARNFKTKETLNYLDTFGLHTSVVDLKKYSTSENIYEKLKKFDLLWVSGGNTYCLRYQMQRSGFEAAINELLNQDEIVYAGESAGACVIGNTLKGHETADEPDFAEKVIWDGLNILPNFILPHTDNVMFADDIQAAREQHKDSNSVIELKDSQALIINGETKKIIG